MRVNVRKGVWKWGRERRGTRGIHGRTERIPSNQRNLRATMVRFDRSDHELGSVDRLEHHARGGLSALASGKRIDRSDNLFIRRKYCGDWGGKWLKLVGSIKEILKGGILLTFIEGFSVGEWHCLLGKGRRVRGFHEFRWLNWIISFGCFRSDRDSIFGELEFCCRWRAFLRRRGAFAASIGEYICLLKSERIEIWEIIFFKASKKNFVAR